MKTVKIGISGMHCQGCVRAVTDALAATPGVVRVDVSLEREAAAVEIDAGAATEEQLQLLEEVIRQAGFVPHAHSSLSDLSLTTGEPTSTGKAAGTELYSIDKPSQDVVESSPNRANSASISLQSPTTSSTSSLKLEIEGMHCASCVGQVEAALSRVEQVASAHVNLPLKLATVRGADSSQPPSVVALIAAVRQAGFTAQVAEDSAERVARIESRDRAERRGWLARAVASAAALSFLLAAGPLQWIPAWAGWPSLVIATALQFYAGGPFFLGAMRRFSAGSANMDTLVALGTSVAFVTAVAGQFGVGERMAFVEPAMIFAFLTTGKWLESRARGQASKAIFGLMRLASDQTRVIRDGDVIVLATRDVVCGETIVVEPGETSPLDAIVANGSSHMNESWLTGESTPVPKQVGDTVFAGAINLDGALQANVIRELDDTTLAQVVHLVHETQQTKTDIQRLADQVVAWFVPAVLAIALVTVIGWSAAGDWSSGLRCAIAVLVVACPCALGLATPMAILVGSSRGANRGILVKNAQSLESGGIVDVVLLDKTGTITAGRPEVVAVGAGIEGAGTEGAEDDLFRIAASVESLSRHPLAAAVAREAKRRGLQTQVGAELKIHEGLGIEAELGTERILIGAPSLLEQRGITLSETSLLNSGEHERAGRTVVWVSRQEKCLGWIAIADPAPPDSRQAVAQLLERSIEVVMLTGDQESTAKAVAAEVGISSVHAELKPQDKLDIVHRLRKQGHVVAMVGDGVNDGPALVAADVGLAMGAGADIAVDSADIVLVNSGLQGAVDALDLARSTRAIIRQNLAWAFGYNIVLLPIAAGVFATAGLRLHPAMAAAAMAMSSISVVLNALRVGWRPSH